MRCTLLIPGLCIIGLVAAAQPGAALDRGADMRSAAASDFSAAKKKKHKQYVYVHQAPPRAYAPH